MKHNWELFHKGVVVDGVSGNLYRDRDHQNYWKWRGNVTSSLAMKFVVDWLRTNKVKPQPKNTEKFIDDEIIAQL